jgi:hypothetical protein
MDRSVHGLVVAFGATVVSSIFALQTQAAVSAGIVPGSFTQGTVQASLGAGTSYSHETNLMGDWWSTTNNPTGAGTKFAISMSNGNFNQTFNGNNTIVAFGNGGGLTLKFDAPVHPVAGQKEFGLFTTQFLNASNGSLCDGNMDASVLGSDDGTNWLTLNGTSVASPTTFTADSSKLNAPSMGYDFGTSSKAWSYGSPGTMSANLAALGAANYVVPMIDDNLFNGTGTNADRLALKNDASESNYDAIFGTSAGGNWFDISLSGLSQVNFVRLNGVNTPNGVRLDAVFANDAAVPEPVGIGTVMLIGSFLLRRPKP